MSEEIDLSLNLDASDYISSANRVVTSSELMSSSYSAVERHGSLMQKAMSQITPGRAVIGGFAGATAAAGAWEQSLSQVQARAAITGQSVTRLSTGIQGLARSFPIGNRGALEIASTLQSMGMAGQGQEKQLVSLSKSFINLGAATGTSASMIGKQMVMLNRSFGGADSNITRFNKMSDSLVGVTAKIGGSSSEILSFSKAIAPMAQQAGIGQTAVMGISAAFSRMGEDGFVASNAMNKVLVDLNRSVRDGSGEMNTYASIVGKTRGEFEELFKASPTKAVQSVLEAFSQPGGQGQRNLERVGIDGVRPQRVFAALGQQGGILEAARTAQEEYGSGATERASKAAMDGLNDEFTKLKATAEQVAMALGRPFLGAITNVMKIAGAPVKGAAAVLDSSLVQKIIQMAVPLVLAAGAFKAVGAFGNAVSMGRQLLVNNRLTQGFAQGSRSAQGQEQTNVRGVYDAVAKARAWEAEKRAGAFGPDPKPMSKPARLALEAGEGFGTAKEGWRVARVKARTDMFVGRGMSPEDAAQYVADNPLPGMGQRIKQGVKNTPRAIGVALSAASTAKRAIQTDSTVQLEKKEALERQTTLRMSPGGAASGLRPVADELKSIRASALPLSQRLAAMTVVMGKFGGETIKATPVLSSAGKIIRNEVGQAATGIKGLAAAVAAFTRSITGNSGQIARASIKERGMAVAGGIKSTAMWGASAVAKVAPQAAFTGGLMLAGYGYNRFNSDKTQAKAYSEEQSAKTSTSVLDEYRDATNRATVAIQSFADQAVSAAKTMSTAASWKDATTITQGDLEYARTTRDKTVRKYAGGPEEIASAVKATSPGGLDIQDMKAITIDLLRQMPQAKVESVLNSLGDYSAANINNKPQQIDYKKIIAPVANSDAVDVGDWAGRHFSSLGRNGNVDVTKDAQSAIDVIAGGIEQTMEINAGKYGTDWSTQEQGRQANEAFEEVRATGNDDVIAAAAERFGKDLTKKDIDTKSGYQYDKLLSGKSSLTDFLASRDKDFGSLAKDAGYDFSGKGGLAKSEKDSALTQSTQYIDTFGKALSNRSGDIDSSLNKSVTAFLKFTGNTESMRKAMAALQGDVESSGGGLSKLADVSLQTVRKMNDASSEVSKLAMAVAERAVMLNQSRAGFQGSATTAKITRDQGKSFMASADETQAGQARYDRGEQMVFSADESDRQRFTARLQAERQFEIQRRRTNEDVKTSTERSTEDFNRSLLNSDVDFNRQRARTYRDFGISMRQSTEDFQTSVKRSTRDFAKSMRRANEDAAKSMYDPYKRIATQGTWDVRNLLVNLASQNKAMATQRKNLDELRKAGVSNQAIENLNLGKAENAQQTARLTSDVLVDPATVAMINKSIADRVNLGGLLNSDASNTDIRRAKEDFAQQLKDQEIEFDKSMRRSKEALARSMADAQKEFNIARDRQIAEFNRGLSRQREDLAKQMTRAREDINEASVEIYADLDALADQVQKAINGDAIEWGTLINDQLGLVLQNVRAAKAEMDRMNPDNDREGRNYEPGGGSAGSGSPVKGTAGGMKSMSAYDVRSGNTTSLIDQAAGGSHAKVTVSSVKRNRNDRSFHNKWQAVDYSGSPKEMLKLASYLQDAALKGKISLSQLIHWSPLTGDKYFIYENKRRDVYSKKTWAGHKDHVHVAMDPAMAQKTIKSLFSPTSGTSPDASGRLIEYAHGGIATKPHMGMVAENGSPEAMIPLNSQGVARLAEAMTRFITGPQMMKMSTAGKGDRVTYTGNTFVTDHSNTFTGAVTVKANDPNQMAREMLARVRRDNLTKPPQRKSNA